MNIHIEKLKGMDSAAKEKLLLFTLSNFKDVNFMIKGEKVLSDKFSHKERKDLIDMAISEMTAVTKIDFLESKMDLADNDEKLYHALGYSINKANDDLDDGTEEVLDINKKFLNYVKVRTVVKSGDKANMNTSYDNLLRKLEQDSSIMKKTTYNDTTQMVENKTTLEGVKSSKKNTSMIKQVFWTMTIATILKKVIKNKGYGE